MSFVITGTALSRQFTVWALLVLDLKNSAYFRRSAVVWTDRKKCPASCTRPERVCLQVATFQNLRKITSLYIFV